VTEKLAEPAEKGKGTRSLTSAEPAEQDSRTQRGVKMQPGQEEHFLIATTVTHFVCIYDSIPTPN
jgi:hypothetical protein